MFRPGTGREVVADGRCESKIQIGDADGTQMGQADEWEIRMEDGRC